jgi:hypothetical protein
MSFAARIRTSILKVQQETRETASRKALKPLDEVTIFFVNYDYSLMMLADCLQCRCQTSQQVFGCIASHLSNRSSENQAYDVSVCRRYKLFIIVRVMVTCPSLFLRALGN